MSGSDRVDVRALRVGSDKRVLLRSRILRKTGEVLVDYEDTYMCDTELMCRVNETRRTPATRERSRRGLRLALM